MIIWSKKQPAVRNMKISLGNIIEFKNNKYKASCLLQYKKTMVVIDLIING